VAVLDDYIAAVAHRDLAAVEQFLAENVVVQDPCCGRITGRAKVLALYRTLFACRQLTLEVRRAAALGNDTYVLEFHLVIVRDDQSRSVVDGVDLLVVSENRILSLRAYLDTSVFVQEPVR
jgi:limonene-1,2-epoxide hydrolase